METDQRVKLKKVINKIRMLVETIEWRDATVRSNEIDIAHQHFKESLQQFEQALWPKK